MDWDDLRIFLAVARASTVSDAARSLQLNHSTVSRRIANLERRLAIRLFDRAGRRLSINPAGEQLRETAERLESTLLSELAALETRQKSRNGPVRIGAPEGLGIGYLASRVGRFVDAYPEIEIELVALPQHYSLAAREVDIAITLDRPDAGNVAIRKLTDYTLQLYAAADYITLHGLPADVSALESHRLCGYIPQLLHTPVLDYLVFDGVRSEPLLKSTSVIAHAQMVRSGAAIGMLPNFLCAGQPELVPILDDARITRSYWLAVHDDMKDIGRVRLVSKALVQMVRRDRTLFLQG